VFHPKAEQSGDWTDLPAIPPLAATDVEPHARLLIHAWSKHRGWESRPNDFLKTALHLQILSPAGETD